MPSPALIGGAIALGAGATAAAWAAHKRGVFDRFLAAGGFSHPDWVEAAARIATAAAKDSLAAITGGTASSVVANGTFNRHGNGRFSLSRATRCCQSPGSAICQESPCRNAPHYGIDIIADRGTPVYAVKTGTVIRAGARSGYGNTVELKHDNEARCSVYAHLDSIHPLVVAGARIPAGNQIGTVGNTGGFAHMGHHLHFEIHEGVTANFGPGRHRVDPVPWLDSNNVRPAGPGPMHLAMADVYDGTEVALAGLSNGEGPSRLLPILIGGVAVFGLGYYLWASSKAY